MASGPVNSGCPKTRIMPRYIIVGFQTDRGGDQTKNLAVFDHVKVNMIRAKFNTYPYPEDGYDLSLLNNQVARAIQRCCNIEY
jgi:hypothetical protein